MRKIYSFLLLALLLANFCLGQKITLNDLIVLNKKKNWEEVNSVLLSKGWTYFSSAKGDEEHYNSIDWSFDKERYSDKAKGWIRLFTYEDIPNKISYTVSNKPAYTIIQNSLASSGFKLVSNKIEDDEIIATYQNNDFEISCRTIKLENDYSASTTGYEFILINKRGIYDPDNGFKKIYYESGVLKQEVNLKNGLLNGSFKQYHENGKLHISGNFLSGEKNGFIKEYYEDGTLQNEYTAVKGEIDGELKQYTDGRLTSIMNYKKGKKHGNCIHLEYDEEGVLYVKHTQAYLNDIENGRWNVVRYAEGEEEEISYVSFVNGLKEGSCKEYLSSDSLQTAEYKNGKLDGLCTLQVLVNLTSMESYEPIYFMPISSISNYSQGLLNGKSTYFTMGNKLSEGDYIDGEKDGKWKYFISMGNYQGEVDYTVNYLKGKQEGVAETFFYSSMKPSIKKDSVFSIGYSIVNFKVNQRMVYKNDLKHGEYELLDSLGRILEKGNYLNDLKEGKWIEVETYDSETIEVTYLKGEYRKGQKIGTWTKSDQNENVQVVFNYNADKLNGETVVWSNSGLVSKKLLFKDDQLIEVKYYDSLGLKPQVKFDIYDVKETNFRCRLTEFYDDYYEIQEYWLLMDKDEEYDPFEFAAYFAYNLETKTGVISSHKDGAYGFYDLDNRPLVLGSYYKEEPTGKWIYFYYSHDLIIEQNRTGPEEYFDLNGKRYTGEFSYIDEETGIKEIRKIKNGFRNGKTKYLSIDNDKVIKTEKYKDGVLED
jgi:antitoxin component YwqK of YwqJK toxin-antitoxin module